MLTKVRSGIIIFVVSFCVLPYWEMIKWAHGCVDRTLQEAQDVKDLKIAPPQVAENNISLIAHYSHLVRPNASKPLCNFPLGCLSDSHYLDMWYDPDECSDICVKVFAD